MDVFGGLSGRPQDGSPCEDTGDSPGRVLGGAGAPDGERSTHHPRVQSTASPAQVAPAPSRVHFTPRRSSLTLDPQSVSSPQRAWGLSLPGCLLSRPFLPAHAAATGRKWFPCHAPWGPRLDTPLSLSTCGVPPATGLPHLLGAGRQRPGGQCEGRGCPCHGAQHRASQMVPGGWRRPSPDMGVTMDRPLGGSLDLRSFTSTVQISQRCALTSLRRKQAGPVDSSAVHTLWAAAGTGCFS